MMRARRILAAALLAMLAACTERTPTVPNFARGGGGPTVTATDPTGAPQDTTLDIRVFGSGYDRGSRADLALDGVLSPKVRTNSTRYVSSSELVANVTITFDADTGAYDVMVTASTGKKGIGTEMFQVRKTSREPPPPIYPSDWTVRDLTAGLTYYTAEAYGINDSGWVFTNVANGGTPRVYLTNETPMRVVILPARVSGRPNGDGDYLTWDPDHVVLADGAGGWTLAPELLVAPHWGFPYMAGVNDAHVVVGHGRDSTRYGTGRGGKVQWYSSPLVWRDGTLGGPGVALNLPTADPGCRVTSVQANAINNGGRIVGEASQEPAVNGAVCPKRALYWDPPYDDPANLPHVLPPSPDFADPLWTARVNAAPMDYHAAGINDAGDVTGGLLSELGKRAVRWMHDDYAHPDVLTGRYAWGKVIDECGRVLVSEITYPLPTRIWPTGWDGLLSVPVPEGMTLNHVWDFRNGRLSGNADPTGTTGQSHTLLWTLDPCPGHWPAP